MGKPPVGKKGTPRPNGLKEQHKKFVEEYLKTGDGANSARAAGYTDANAARHAYQLTHKNKAVMDAIKAGRERFTNKCAYGLAEAMKEAADAIEFAKETNNANAYVKAVELRSKINGLIIDKHDVRNLSNFSINIVGLPGQQPQEALPTPIPPPIVISSGN